MSSKPLFQITRAREAVNPCHFDALTFQPVHNSKIVAVDKFIDKELRKYLAYDCDPGGHEIRLYYSNDLDEPWTPYSGNPVLVQKTNQWTRKTEWTLGKFLGWSPKYLRSSRLYRWPTTVWDGSAFHMFLANHTGKRIERWTSPDGINYTFQETINVGMPTEFMNPFCWKNPNDNHWYLYHKQNGTPRVLLVRSHRDLAELASAADRKVLCDTGAGEGSVAAPAVFYYRGYYWLMTAGSHGGGYQIYVFKSSSPDAGFVMTDDSPVLTNDEAVPNPFLSPDGARIYLYVSRRIRKNKWIAEIRKLYHQEVTHLGFVKNLPAIPKINVCIATYKRPLLLRNLLGSLIAQITEGKFNINIIVIDNDLRRSAETVVMEFAAHSRPIIYDVEPEQNISLARNKALSHATGDLIATIDDDEYADPYWLFNLYQTMLSFRADVVMGPVVRIFPQKTSDYVKQNPSYKFPNPPSGSTRNFVHSTRSCINTTTGSITIVHDS